MKTSTKHFFVRILSKVKSHPASALIALYFLLTFGYAISGFLHNLDDRIRGADSVYYYVYLPSVFFDGDFDFLNNFAQVPDGMSYTKLGKVENVFSIGPAILWSPFFVVGHVVTLIARVFGSTLEANGNTSIYHLLVYLGNSLYGLAGLILTNRLLRQFVPIGVALLATVAIMSSSQITLYLWDFTAMSHNCSLFMGALFLLTWRRHGMHPFTALAGALMILVRWEDGLLLLVPALAALVEIPVVVRQGQLRRWLGQALLFLGVLIAGCIPQFLAWKEMFGSYLLVPQGSGFLKFSNLPLFEFFFSTRHGLFLWHPILLFGLIGLFFLWRREKILALALLSIFIVEVIINAGVSDWWAAWSFGQRRFINYLPVFTLGLGLLINRCVGIWQKRIVYSFITLLAVWNLLFVNQYLLGTIPHAEALTPREMIVDKFQTDFILKTREIGVSAIEAYSQGNLNMFHTLANRTYVLNPHDRPNRAVFVFSALYFNQHHQEAIKAMQQWLNDEPGALLPRWGIAEILVREQMYDKALDLFPVSSGMSLVEKSVREKIEARAESTFTPTFGQLLVKYLLDFDYH